MKKTLITGAAGFLGSHLVNKFLKEANIKNLKAENFKRYGSARKLYNFDIDNLSKY